MRRALLGMVLAVVLLAAAPAMATVTSRVQDIEFTDASTGFMVGGSNPGIGWSTVGFLSRTTDGGSTWTPVTVSGRWFYGLSAVPAGPVWATSHNSERAFVSFAWPNWTTTASLGSIAYPEDIASIGGSTVVVVGGMQGVGLDGAQPWGDPATIWRSTDHGTKWSLIWKGPAQPPATDGEIPKTYAKMESVDAASGAVWAVGTEYANANAAVKAALAKCSVDNGATFMDVTLPKSTYMLSSVSALSATEAWAVGNGRILKSTDGASFVAAAAMPFTGLVAVDARTADKVAVVGTLGRVAITTNGGSTWKSWTHSSKPTLWSVAFRDDSTLVVAGDDGHIAYLTLAADGSVASAKTGRVVGGSYPAVAHKITFSAPSTSSYASAKLTGKLTTSSGAPAGDRPVLIEQSANRVTWTTLTTRTTSSSGTFSYTAKPKTTTYYRASYAAGGAASPMRTVKPKASLTTPVVSTKMKYKRRYTLYGYVKPVPTTVSIQAYRYESGKWRLKTTYPMPMVDAAGKYTYSIVLPSKGSWRLRAYHKSDARNATTYSSYRNVSVK